MRSKFLIARQSYPLGVISNCRQCTLYGKFDGLIPIGREQTLHLMELAINYNLDKIEHTYSILLSFAMQPLMQENMAAQWSEIVLINFVDTRIGILHLNHTSIQAPTSKRELNILIMNIYPYLVSQRSSECFKIY